jgi:predicted outer membrane repeat protein
MYSTIMKNRSSIYGGAMYLKESSPLISNVLFYKNEAKKGGAIYAYNSSPKLVNVTMAYNKASQEGGAIFLYNGNHFKVRNSIIWSNQASSAATIGYGEISDENSISFFYSNIDTISPNSIVNDKTFTIQWESSNICEDPRFNDANSFDFTLRQNSPCIDAGDPVDDVGEEPEPNGNRINIGAYGGTAQAAVTNPVSSIETNQPSEFMLAQNYPNPFNATTTIEYHLPTKSDVNLVIYNVIGQKIITIVSEKQSAGQYRHEWDASNMASGAYFYRLAVNTSGANRERFSQMKKMILVK